MLRAGVKHLQLPAVCHRGPELSRRWLHVVPPSSLCCPPAHQDAPWAKSHASGTLPHSRLSERGHTLLHSTPVACHEPSNSRGVITHTPAHTAQQPAPELGTSSAPMRWGQDGNGVGQHMEHTPSARSGTAHSLSFPSRTTEPL